MTAGFGSTSAAEPSPSSHSRLVLVLAAAGFASSFALRSAEPLVGVLARDLESDPHTVALLSAAFALPYALIQPILGPVGDALGKERVLVAVLAALTVALIGCSAAPNLELLFGLRMIAGAAAGGCIPLSLAMLGDRVPIAQRQVAISRFLVAVILGQLLGSTFAGLIEAFVGWRGVFASTGIVAALGCATTLFGFDKDNRAPPRPIEVRQAIARYGSLIANPRARLLFSAVFVEGVAIFGVLPYIAPLLAARGEGGPREAGLVLAGFAVGGLLYSLMVPLMLRFLGIYRMLIVGGAICAVALLIVGLAGNWPVDCAAFVGLGLGFYMLHNTYQVQVTELSSTARASAVALHAFSYFCGQAISVAIFGFTLEHLGQFPALSLCAAVIFAVGVVTSIRLAQRPKAA